LGGKKIVELSFVSQGTNLKPVPIHSDFTEKNDQYVNEITM